MSRFLTARQQKIAVVGLALILVALLMKVFLLSKAPVEAIQVPEVHYRHHPAATTAKKAKVVIDKTLPAPLRRQLAKHKVVVAVLYSSGQDSDALAAARQGAAGAHAGFAALDVTNEAVAKAIAMKTSSPYDPSVLVVTRPGTIAFLLPGYIDPEAVVAAVRSAR